MPKQTIKLYGGKVEIEYWPETHRYKVNGESVISVTAATGIVDKSRPLIFWALGLTDKYLRSFLAERPDLVDKAELLLELNVALKQHQIVKEEAASNGKLVHAWAEAFALAKRDGASAPAIGDDLPDAVVAGINGFLDWVNSHKVTFLETEQIIYSRTHNYVGLVDAVAKVDGKKMLVDYKTSKGIYNEMRYQVSAYRNAWEEERENELDGSVILRFDKETGAFETFPLEDHQADFTAFLGCLTIKRREKELTKKI